MIVSAQELRDHLNLTDQDSDDFLNGKIAAADAWVAAFTGEALTEKSPAPLREAVLKLAGDLYENREGSLSGMTAQQLPFGVADLITPYRAWAF